MRPSRCAPYRRAQRRPGPGIRVCGCHLRVVSDGRRPVLPCLGRGRRQRSRCTGRMPPSHLGRPTGSPVGRAGWFWTGASGGPPQLARRAEVLTVRIGASDSSGASGAHRDGNGPGNRRPGRQRGIARHAFGHDGRCEVERRLTPAGRPSVDASSSELPRAAQRLRPQRSRGSSPFPFRSTWRPPWGRGGSDVGRVHRVRPGAGRPARRPRPRRDRRPGRDPPAPTRRPPMPSAWSRSTRSHLESSWLPLLDRIAASRAMAAPIEAMSIDDVLDFLRDDPLGELIFDLVDVADECDLDEVDGNWSTDDVDAAADPEVARALVEQAVGPRARSRARRRRRPGRHDHGRGVTAPATSDGAWERIDDEVGWYEDAAGVGRRPRRRRVGPGVDVRPVPLRVGHADGRRTRCRRSGTSAPAPCSSSRWRRPRRSSSRTASCTPTTTGAAASRPSASPAPAPCPAPPPRRSGTPS